MRSLTSRNSASFCAIRRSRSSIARPRIERSSDRRRIPDLRHQRESLEAVDDFRDRLPIDLADLVARHDQERVASQAHRLVLLQRQQRDLGTPLVRTLTQKRQPPRSLTLKRDLRSTLDLLVCSPEPRLVPSYALGGRLEEHHLRHLRNAHGGETRLVCPREDPQGPSLRWLLLPFARYALYSLPPWRRAFRTFAGVSGICRMRTPVASKTALPMAAGTTASSDSPTAR